MSKYLVTKVESFTDDDTKWEVTDTEYPEALGGPRVIATFIDGAVAMNFVTWMTENDKQFKTAVKEVTARYSEAFKRMPSD